MITHHGLERFRAEETPEPDEPVLAVVFYAAAIIVIWLVFMMDYAIAKPSFENDVSGYQTKVHKTKKHKVRTARHHQVRQVRTAKVERRRERVKVAGTTQYLPHPPGCPRALFCGCGAAVDLFGKPVRSLWPSRAWFKFPRTEPAHNTVAVRSGHVFVLKRHVEGRVWLVADYNSGGRKSRMHHRSIAGYTIVQPNARYAEAK